MADRKDGDEVKPELSPATDVFAAVREAVDTVARNLGLATEPKDLSPEHWQRVLAAVEAQAQMRGVSLPAGWEEKLAAQMGRVGPDANAAPES